MLLIHDDKKSNIPTRRKQEHTGEALVDRWDVMEAEPEELLVNSEGSTPASHPRVHMDITPVFPFYLMVA